MNKELNISKKRNVWVHYGYGKRIAFGFSLDKYNLSIDFLCFWIGVEF